MTKKEKIKKEKTVDPIVFPNDYIVFSADLSLKRPGFCVLHIIQKDGAPFITSIQTRSIDNKNAKKTRGQLLQQIIAYLFYVFTAKPYQNAFFVREKSVNSFGGGDSMASKTAVASVVGAADYVLWSCYHKEWHEIYPVTVKKLITGSGKAQKSDVAKALTAYLGTIEFACDDESDAAAVAIAWLLQNNQNIPKKLEVDVHE